MAKRLNRKTAMVLSLLAALLLLPQARAESDALVQQALALSDKGQAKEAYELLAPTEAARAGDPDFDLVLGIAANQTAQYSQAIFALERVLVVRPDDARARAELARALFAVGDTKEARLLLTQTKAQGVPPEVAKTIDQFLQAIDKVEEAAQSSVKAYVEFGLGYDSNVNSGPGTTTFAVPLYGGALLTLLPASQPIAAAYSTLSAGVSARRVIDSRWSLIGNLNASVRANGGNASSSDTQQLDVGAGASYREDKNEYSVVLQAGTGNVSGARARDQVGVVGEWIYRLDGFRQFSTYAQLGRISYPQSIADVQRNVFGTSYAQLFRDGLIVFGGIYGGYENQIDPNFPHLGHKLWGWRAGVQKPLGETLSLFASLGFEDRQFNGQDPQFLLTRQDQQYTLNLGLNWVPAKFWRVAPLLSLGRTTSNKVLNDSSRQALGVTVRREF